METVRFTAQKLAIRFIPSLFLILGMGLSLIVATPAQAEIPTPRLKPPAPNASQYLSDKDAQRFRKGVSAAKRGRWTELNQNIRNLNDPIATDTLRWLRAARNPNASLDDLSYVVQNLSNCCLLYTSPSPRDKRQSRMPSSA